MEKKLKTILIVLLMILICLIGFGGIYLRNKIILKNQIPDYELTGKVKGTRITTFILDDATNEVIYDSEGNKVDSIPEGENEENYNKENVPVNADESKNTDNYIKAKNIIINRLKSLGMSEYDVRVDKENGNISVELNENKNTDSTLAELLVVGKFEVIDTDDKTQLMSTEDIESAKVLYNNTTSGISVYLTINFTKEGTKKFEQITKDYAKISDSSSEDTEANTQKTITINIDDDKFLSTSFNDVIKTGELTVMVGSASTDTDAVTENITSAQYYSTILNNGEMPLKYKTQSSEYIESIYSNDLYVYITVGILLAIAVISIIYLIIRFRTLGLISSIIYIATIALITIAIRLIGIEIGIQTIISGIIILFIMDYVNYIVLRNIRKEDKIDEIKLKVDSLYKRIFNIIIVALIPAIILTYNSLLLLSNIGATLFWGIIIASIMNIIFTKKILLMRLDNK